ncbi:MAG: lysozyme inhibitor LprI family protein [Rhizobiaceae bacterium]
MTGARSVFLALLLCCGPALAEDEPEIDCADMTNLPQQHMNWCAGQDFEAADAELNAVWRESIAAARLADTELKDMGDDGRPGYEETLKAGQRAWIGYRDGWCAYVGFQARGGSLEPFLVSSCMAGLTRARTRELQDDLEGLGN